MAKQLQFSKKRLMEYSRHCLYILHTGHYLYSVPFYFEQMLGKFVLEVAAEVIKDGKRCLENIQYKGVTQR